MGLEEYWKAAAKDAEQRALAGCRAVGTAAYLFGVGCDLSDTERVQRFAEVFTALAEALDLNDPIPPRTPFNGTGRSVAGGEPE